MAFLKQRNLSVADAINRLGYKRIAIYGMKELGHRLYDELINSNVEITCLIDKNKDTILGDYKILDLNDEIPEADAVIVTAYYYFPEIQRSLANKVSCPILSLDHIIYNAYK